MQETDLIGIGLFLGYYVVAALPPLLLLTLHFDAPFEMVRKVVHLVQTLSIFPLVMLFSTWYASVLAAFMLVVVAYPALVLVENSSLYRRVAPEREPGEIKRSLIIVQASMATLIFIFWGLLGIEWRYVAVVAVMAWGLGDAAAALVGKTFGRRQVEHRWVEGAKTMEGTQAMLVTAGATIFGMLLIYAGQPWYVSFATALLVAPVCAVVELFSHRGMDTVTVPISTGVAILWLISLLSFVGVY